MIHYIQKLQIGPMNRASSLAQRQFEPLSVEENISAQESMSLTPRHYGNMIPILIDPQTASPRYILGPHFYIFVPTWFVSIGLLIFILGTLMARAISWLWGLSIGSGIVFLYLYAKTGLSSPGIASSSCQPDAMSRRSERYCIPCTKHCYYCDVCIYEMDHHCPWVGKCIGRDNLCLFYKFLASVTILLGCLLSTALTAQANGSASKP